MDLGVPDGGSGAASQWTRSCFRCGAASGAGGSRRAGSILSLGTGDMVPPALAQRWHSQGRCTMHPTARLCRAPQGSSRAWGGYWIEPQTRRRAGFGQGFPAQRDRGAAVNPGAAGVPRGCRRGRSPRAAPEQARRVRAGGSPGQALTKPGAARDMPGGLHTSWNRFQPRRLPVLHLDPAKPVAPVAGAGAGLILSLCPIAGAGKRLFHGVCRGELPGARCARVGDIAVAPGGTTPDHCAPHRWMEGAGVTILVEPTHIGDDGTGTHSGLHSLWIHGDVPCVAPSGSTGVAAVTSPCP